MKLTHELLGELEEAFGASTLSNNRFRDALRILERRLGTVFEADGERYYVFDNAIFTTPSCDPFDMPWRPSVTWRDCGETREF